MGTQWRWFLKDMVKQLWFRATVFSLVGVLSALLAIAFKDYVPEGLSMAVGSDAVDKILGILASSMLAVTTFSLSTMVTAYGSTSSGVTPRATTLMMEDSTTQNALATFIGSFLFSLVGIIALSTGVYGNQGRVLLFGVTIAVIVVIVYTLLRWIDYLSRLGRIGDTIDLVEHATVTAIERRNEQPTMGASPYPATLPEGLQLIASPETGYLQFVDVKALGAVAQQQGLAIYVPVVPGSFVAQGEPLAYVQLATGPNPDQSHDQDLEKRVRLAFTLGVRRVFEHDPRFGLAVLSEIASRALSPAVNDPGTAIDVIGRGVRTLGRWGRETPGESHETSLCSNVFMPSLEVADLFEDFFSPIARDGAALIEVSVRLLKALGSLARMNPEFSSVAARQAAHVLSYSDHALVLDEEKQTLRRLVSDLGLSGQR
ncbi:DUF2254 domain-containing protein [Pseudomonas sp. CDFA 602]|uniref:DUF2254 domain-containing protein n=1 Tax=Pseudomonas californiensis TaxID=2829823 RepID=UPI001E2CCD78|nr:DUF2254 domain-containing protein [Pseudomonas californiensis]MCD5994212.1 DUF2254 domain-containing protein [Pseudomonas californiensis]MCD5999689.1 DUF2254 domain-containing protein [Pseudomonas californiensis]